MKCNGCGGDIGFGDPPLAGVFGYGDVSTEEKGGVNVAYADYFKELCPRCQHVLKDILLSSDLSDHWHKYEWEMKGDIYVEDYDSEDSESESSVNDRPSGGREDGE